MTFSPNTAQEESQSCSEGRRPLLAFLGSQRCKQPRPRGCPAGPHPAILSGPCGPAAAHRRPRAARWEPAEPPGLQLCALQSRHSGRDRLPDLPPPPAPRAPAPLPASSAATQTSLPEARLPRLPRPPGAGVGGPGLPGAHPRGPQGPSRPWSQRAARTSMSGASLLSTGAMAAPAAGTLETDPPRRSGSGAAASAAKGKEEARGSGGGGAGLKPRAGAGPQEDTPRGGLTRKDTLPIGCGGGTPRGVANVRGHAPGRGFALRRETHVQDRALGPGVHPPAPPPPQPGRLFSFRGRKGGRESAGSATALCSSRLS